MTNRKTLQDFVDSKPDLVDYFRNDSRPAHFARAGARATGAFIPPEFTNWRDEKRAPFETAGLLHQSHHMSELFVNGPGAFDLLKSVSINSFENFSLDRAKQLVACTPQGHMIGDCIAYRLGEESFELVSGTPLLNWVEYQAEVGGYDVELTRDEASNVNPEGGRLRYRFELAGPNAGLILDKIVEGEVPDIPFFQTRTLRIGGHDVLVLRHGMVGKIAVELSGPYTEEEAVRSYILQEGAEFGLMPIGTTVYFSNSQTGWMAYPVPGIYTAPELTDYRTYLPANTWEAGTELAGSYVAPRIEDYYVTPFDLGYKRLINYDHDFHGREALRAMGDDHKRTKVTLVWNRDDVVRIWASQLGSGPRYKALELPQGSYSLNQFDEVRSLGGELIGLSCRVALAHPISDVISQAILDPSKAEIGSEVEIVWGEPGGGSRKPGVERHEQTTVRATVAPSPYGADTQRVTRNDKLT